MTKTTKADLQVQLANLQASISNLPDYKTLAVCSENMVPFGIFERRMDLREMDSFRDHVKRRLVHQLVDDLIRSGAVSFQEDLEEDYRHYGKKLRVTAKLKIAA